MTLPTQARRISFVVRLTEREAQAADDIARRMSGSVRFSRADVLRMALSREGRAELARLDAEAAP